MVETRNYDWKCYQMIFVHWRPFLTFKLQISSDTFSVFTEIILQVYMLHATVYSIATWTISYFDMEHAAYESISGTLILNAYE